ncbi:hypothetical protein [Phenylobacterium sp.]|uniref:hypothetical protein n=1 Tax=Phenylobacterium sp. TaxID=1871053 RepID=UPI002B7EB8F0|nr:hypothetical protein [Phenylobacterium sp.]HLZ73392.1 hypothetical protein [Phenylobacterium sp.]
MDAFSYLSVLLSIILGLAITQVLMGYRGLLLARGRVRFYAPAITWSALLLVIAAQNWWSSFGLARHRDWTFLQFSVVLLQMALLYMMAGLVLPDIPADAPVDLKAHYYRERRPFYLAFLLLLAVSVSKDFVLDGHLPAPENLAFHGVFATFSLLAALIRKPRFHEIVTPIGALVMAAYIALLFFRLA